MITVSRPVPPVTIFFLSYHGYLGITNPQVGYDVLSFGQSSRRKAIISPSDLSHHRTYRSVYGGSINLTCNSLFGVVVFHGYKTKLS